MGAIKMKLDFKSLAFGFKLEDTTSTPAWETSLGQGKMYKIAQNPSVDELLKGMIYKGVPPKAISFKKGKGGAFVQGDSDNAALVIAAVFDKVYVNDRLIEGGKYILLVAKDDSESHKGRLKLKYGPDNTYKENDNCVLKNQNFIELAIEQLGMASDACWFVYDISVENQDVLRLNAKIVNKDGPMTYKDSKAHHEAWKLDLISDDEPLQTDESFDWNELKGDAVNKIFYGVPGCGKSFHIDHVILGKNLTTKKYDGEYNENNIIRTTFYQDYSNTDFIGQILPKIMPDEDGKDIVEYVFNPGPFTLALIQAIKNPSKNVALVVEEINRGNAPAIFGDTFQLLDRDENGISDYGIVNVGVMDFLKKFNFGTYEEPVYYDFSEIKIPGNMSIYATMNTSDQNVFTLDTAFTRRWIKERIPNVFNGHEIEGMLIPCKSECSWGKFVNAINAQITHRIDDLQVNEDKQLGAFFVKKSDLLNPKDEKSIRSFAYKVLEYLWDDVSKLDRSVLFNSSYNTFEELVKGYADKGIDVFNDDIIKTLTQE